jgi:chitinase
MRKKVVFLFILFSSLFSVNFSQAQLKVVGYLPSWNGYPNSITNVDLTKLTHINIAFANPNSTGDLSTSNGTLTDLATVVTAAHAQGVLVLMSIGGAGAPGSTYTNLIVNNQAAFVSKIVQYAVDNNLDGIDVDIEGDVLDGTTMTSTQYQSFVSALVTGLHAQSKIMTAALATWFGNRITNTAASKFDFINVMSYDAYGTWTGPGQHSSYDMAVSDLNYWHTTKAVPLAQLNVGVPFYGYSWSSSKSSMDYKAIVASYSGAENKDQINLSGGGVIYYNGIPTIKQKTALAKSQAGGVMIWQLTGDATGTKSLLAAIDQVKQGYATDIAPTVSIAAPVASAVYTEGDTVQIDITAADSDGSIIKAEFYAGTFKIGELNQAPFTTIKWTGVGSGSYTLTVQVTDNLGVTTTSAPVSITVNSASSSLPFLGTAANIPGKIEAENFNLGGNNVSYYDLTSTNLGGSYRTGNVDIEACGDNGYGYDIGWTDAGEWLEYSVNVIATGYYDLQSRVASPNSNQTFYIEMDGVNVTGTVNVPNTGNWGTWQTVSANAVHLTQGQKKMRIHFPTGGFNLNYVNATVATAVVERQDITETNSIYPNPFSQSAFIKFNLKKSGLTKVTIADQMGKEIAVIAHEPMVAGTQELSFQNYALPKGNYICFIRTEEETIAIKMLVE